jgi:hypothetical protein
MKSLYKVEKLKKLGEVEGKGGFAECLRFPMRYDRGLGKMITSSVPLWTLQVTNCFVSLHIYRREDVITFK